MASQTGKSKSNLKAEEEVLGFMPFAFTCAADVSGTKGFGVKMVALLVAVLVDGLEGWNIHQEGKLPDPSAALGTDRHALTDIELIFEGMNG